MFDQQTVNAVRAHATRLAIEEAMLFAVIEIESDGRTFELIKGRKEPLIRWEGHYFDQRLTGDERDEARRKGLASPRAGAIKNPASQVKRWQMLTDASRINAQAAYESASYGVGQVMGAHWQKLRFASIDALVAKARESVAGQVEIMVRYIEAFGLVDELQRKDFSAFTRGYNGPAGIKGGYHLLMAKAYASKTGKALASVASGMLRMGSQ
ncbi:N-acetylmuramidase domain-containing protein, partial [Pseudaminobacter soli (ex Li et al. 2025)]